jgi:hypothetical protein
MSAAERVYLSWQFRRFGLGFQRMAALAKFALSVRISRFGSLPGRVEFENG